MGKAKLMKVSYYDSKAEVRLTTYADTVVYDPKANIIVAIRFGGYPEQVKAMADAMFGGGGFDIETEESRSRRMYSLSKQYQRKISHDGIYAEATLLVKDDELTAANADQEEIDKPKKTFIFCEQNKDHRVYEKFPISPSDSMAVEFGVKPPKTSQEVVVDYVLDFTSPFKNVIMETEQGGLDYRYTYGLDINSVYMHHIKSDGKLEESKLFYHNDRQGSTDFLSKSVTGSSNSAVEYDAWGLTTKHEALSLPHRR